MTEDTFIELAIKYLDQAANAAEVEQLTAAMLDHPERRALYRDLVQQSQLAHEWQASSAVPAKARRPITKLAIITTAAAAAIILTVFSIHLSQNDNPATEQLADNHTETYDFFKGSGPSWQTLYPSIFEQPDFVWRSEFSTDTSASETPDVFTENGIPPVLATTLDPEFSRRIEPIAMLPGSLY